MCKDETKKDDDLNPHNHPRHCQCGKCRKFTPTDMCGDDSHPRGCRCGAKNKGD